MYRSKLYWVAAVTLFVFLLATESFAADFNKSSYRSLTTEATIGLRYVEKETIDFEGGAKADINSDYGWGFGFGYNVDENIGLSGDFSWLSTGYRATRVDDNGDSSNYNGILDASSLTFRGTYYLMKTRMTPFVSAQLGWTHIDTNIPTGPPGTVCWWDPFWGYICGTYVPTETKTVFGYGAGLGLRWDISTRYFMKASYNWTKQDISNTSSHPGFNNITIDFGFFMN